MTRKTAEAPGAREDLARVWHARGRWAVRPARTVIEVDYVLCPAGRAAEVVAGLGEEGWERLALGPFALLVRLKECGQAAPGGLRQVGRPE